MTTRTQTNPKHYITFEDEFGSIHAVRVSFHKDENVSREIAIRKMNKYVQKSREYGFIKDFYCDEDIVAVEIE